MKGVSGGVLGCIVCRGSYVASQDGGHELKQQQHQGRGEWGKVRVCSLCAGKESIIIIMQRVVRWEPLPWSLHKSLIPSKCNMPSKRAMSHLTPRHCVKDLKLTTHAYQEPMGSESEFVIAHTGST